MSGFAGLAPDVEHGSFGSRQLRSRLEIGRRYQLFDMSVTPLAAMEFATLWSDAFVESGYGTIPGLFALGVQGRSQLSAPISLGARGQRVFQLGDGMTFTPSLTLADLHEFSPQRRNFGTLVDLPTTSWLVDAARTGSDAAQVKAGAQLALNRWAAIFAGFDGEFSSKA